MANEENFMVDLVACRFKGESTLPSFLENEQPLVAPSSQWSCAYETKYRRVERGNGVGAWKAKAQCNLPAEGVVVLCQTIMA